MTSFTVYRKAHWPEKGYAIIKTAELNNIVNPIEVMQFEAHSTNHCNNLFLKEHADWRYHFDFVMW